MIFTDLFASEEDRPLAELPTVPLPATQDRLRDRARASIGLAHLSLAAMDQALQLYPHDRDHADFLFRALGQCLVDFEAAMQRFRDMEECVAEG